MFKYIFEGESHSDTSEAYMLNIGMDNDQIESVLRQQEFELQQSAVLRKKAYEKESDPLYMEAQFDGTAESLQLWRDKVTEIKARYPGT